MKFWKAWPPGVRKTGRPQCEALWAAQGLEAKAAEIVGGVEAAKQSAAWAKEGGAFIPAPARWLGEAGWEGFTEAAAKWWETEAGANRVAASLGLAPWSRTEAFPPYRDRIRAAYRDSNGTDTGA